jgi:hypothetical protein
VSVSSAATAWEWDGVIGCAARLDSLVERLAFALVSALALSVSLV